MVAPLVTAYFGPSVADELVERLAPHELEQLAWYIGVLVDVVITPAVAAGSLQGVLAVIATHEGEIAEAKAALHRILTNARIFDLALERVEDGDTEDPRLQTIAEQQMRAARVLMRMTSFPSNLERIERVMGRAGFIGLSRQGSELDTLHTMIMLLLDGFPTPNPDLLDALIGHTGALAARHVAAVDDLAERVAAVRTGGLADLLGLRPSDRPATPVEELGAPHGIPRQ